MLKLRELEIFYAIMRGGSITEAARLLGISQPAVSTALRYAEDQLGMPLFRRAHGRIEPTPEALSLLPEVETLFQKFESIRRYAEDLREAQSGLLSMASTPSLSYSYLAPAVKRFREQHPNVRVVMNITNSRRVVELANTSQIDIGVIASPFNAPELTAEDLTVSELRILVHKDHPLARQSVIRPQDLKRYSLITNTHHSIYDAVQATFRSCKVDLNVAIAVNHHVTTCLLLDTTTTVALVDPWMPVDVFPDLVQRDFVPRIETSARVVWSAARPMSRTAQVFVEELRGGIALEHDDLRLRGRSGSPKSGAV
ncbi:DNA-binding transcriptional regulator, LysR family [Phyllobacterium sp. CL33Tsu]|uniref:LysR family transcriptional regulator n=1 Tax=Phyllobacterium sp. CL33Tsu TaxID=1798191 RepID=UPI0008DF0C23|nr:LysR family transcriptional regulator [Phyllobacterium sp. CL33Tsu]SFJ28467.1 DNA-binding transcriptional regulator, LysR family [Phyllobacterium sp. CL33Tsu]